MKRLIEHVKLFTWNGRRFLFIVLECGHTLTRKARKENIGREFFCIKCYRRKVQQDRQRFHKWGDKEIRTLRKLLELLENR